MFHAYQSFLADAPTYACSCISPYIQVYEPVRRKTGLEARWWVYEAMSLLAGGSFHVECMSAVDGLLFPVQGPGSLE